MADGADYRLQNDLQIPLADMPEPAWCAAPADGADCETQPRQREQRPYGLRPIAGVAESTLAEMTVEELLALRDKVDCYIRGHSFERTRMPVDVREIIKRAAEECDVSVLDILSLRKKAAIAVARKRAMASAYALMNADGSRRFSSTMVGKFFRRDHSTVRHAVITLPDEELIRL